MQTTRGDERMVAVMGVRKALFALVYDRQMGKVEAAGLREVRQRLLADVDGDVLEIGAGTGVNLALYGPGVRSLIVTEPDPAMLRRLEQHVRERAPHADARRAPAERLPFAEESFDVAVSTLVLCGVRDQRQALGELARVLRPGGRLLFLEHVRSSSPGTARWQDRLTRLHHAVVGCDCNRRTLEAIEAAGFEIERVEHRALPKAPPVSRPLVVGSAHRL